MSVREGVKEYAGWARSERALKRKEQHYGEKLVELANKHSGEAFVTCDDPLKVAIFSVLIETLKTPGTD